MSHVIISVQPGTGAGGEAEITIKYTPAHTVPGAEQIRKIQRAGRMAERIADFLYNTAPEPADETQ